MKISFLGLGIMGSRMAANLARAGHELTVWNRTAATAQQFASEHGVGMADSPQAAVAAADVVFSMVVDGAQVESLLLDAADGARPNTLFADCSTIGPVAAERVGAALSERGHRFLDAPVTGSAPRAADATLTFMVGGEHADYEQVKPLLEAMGRLIVHAGPRGQGQVVKVINNALAAVNATAVGQALLAAKAAGADLDALVQVASSGSGGSAMLELKSSAMREHDYTPLFKLDHMLKDVRLCLSEVGDFEFATDAEQVLSGASERGYGDKDFAALIEVLEARSGNLTKPEKPLN
ncbi:MAG: NAD(P)-dependent oxidoreductase [Solirubrobacterales bacterium]|nr:NAD(P)-dependent oxidoreductase [Solirubrobacterales bacterium]